MVYEADGWPHSSLSGLVNISINQQVNNELWCVGYVMEGPLVRWVPFLGMLLGAVGGA